MIGQCHKCGQFGTFEYRAALPAILVELNRAREYVDNDPDSMPELCDYNKGARWAFDVAIAKIETLCEVRTTER